MRNREPAVLIMMATYNGEKYINEQINSIINQDYSNWHLIIQDDRSEDKTIEILSFYVQKDNRIEFRVSDYPRGGANRNFHSLINYCKNYTNYDFYIFSDQDDVWYKNKISIMVGFLEKHSDRKIPSLVYADMALVNGKGNRLEGTIGSKTDNGFKNKKSYFFSHNVYGCNMMMNNALFVFPPNINVESKEELIVSHDNYYAKSASLIGKIFYMNVVLMDYRRHGENVTAAQNYDFGISRILKRLRNIDALAKDHAYTYSQTLVIIRKYQEYGISESQKKLIDEIEKVIRKGGIDGISYVLQNHISWGNNVRTVSHVVIMFLCLYKKYLLV